uniref:NADH-ubiquinone oxidoreductase chain 1 n=1 Tax=Scutopus robustus TaxID=2109553 RepID=A0A343YNB7_9MOLL|nr:NADH dehydrogenase subunit 1 [Scutopus robustus]AWL21424.1 NADH dehydrogenase subunit 1 [Scutopus robustus]
MSNVGSVFFLLICVLVAVAFFTMLERKVLGYMALRKGPNKVGFLGVLQPMSDAVKLFTKEFSLPSGTFGFLFISGPIFNLFLMLSFWLVFPFFYLIEEMTLGFLYFLCLSSLSVYALMLSGWSSTSKFALLGAYRAVSQTISYEISMVFVLLIPFFSLKGFDFSCMASSGPWFLFLSLPLFCMWMFSLLAEANRAPMDMAEGESELVSGFNVEYSGGGFAMVFMAEYGSILLLSVLTVVVFGGGFFFFVSSPFFFSMKFIAFSFFFVWVRAAYPRIRYNILMDITWKCFLPVSVSLVFCGIGMLWLFS